MDRGRFDLASAPSGAIAFTRRRISSWTCWAFPVELAQSIWGRGGVPYALLLPNLLIFGLFTFAPMILNFYVSMTDGTSISLFARPFVGLAKYAEIFDCVSILEPKSCSNAGYNFWTGMFNTLWFVVFQVPILCAVALLTALVVNKNLKGTRVMACDVFLPRHAVARCHRQHLELGAAPQGSAQRGHRSAQATR